jgi:hypothetical protein
MRHLDSIRPLAERVQILSGRAADGGLYASLTADEATGRPVLEDVLVNGRLVRRPKLVVNGLKAFFDQALAGASTPEKALELGRRQAAVFREALEDQTGRKQQALNALRVTTVDNYIRAKSNWALFFRPVTLADDESPVFRHTYRNEVTIRYLGEDGSVQTVRAVAAQKLVYPDLRLLSSERVGYPVRDIYNGDISVAAQRTVDIGFDLAAKVDAECKRMLDGGFAAFTTTGEKLDRTYVKNTRLVAANLPTTNDLALADNGPNTKFRLECLTAALRYCAQWTGLFPDGDLAPTGVVIVPSIDAADIADQFSPTGNYSSEVSNQVLAGGEGERVEGQRRGGGEAGGQCDP